MSNDIRQDVNTLQEQVGALKEANYALRRQVGILARLAAKQFGGPDIVKAVVRKYSDGEIQDGYLSDLARVLEDTIT